MVRALLALALAAAPAAAKTATATFDMDGVTGTVSFEEATAATGAVTISVSLAGLQDTPNPWHVHDFPVGSGCGAAETGGHFFNQAGVEVGDLTAEFGELEDGDDTFTDTDLTLWGVDSVVGRSVVLHRSDGERYACATIEYADAALKTVTSYFDSPLAGTITLQQDSTDDTADTSILLDLWYAADPDKATADHGWHLHENRIPLDGTCSDAGGHFDPDGLGTADCVENSDDMSTCGIGELTAKHGLISFPATGAGKYMWTDTNLPLSGANAVAGLSMVVHEADANGGGARIACASLAKTAVVDLEGYGTVEFFQGSALDDTVINVDLAGLLDTPNPWHVHDFPVADGDCSAAGTGGHFFNEAGVEVGDLTATLGELEDGAESFTDGSITLHGSESIMGRSVVLHQQSDNARYTCGTIQRIETEAVVTAELASASGVATGTATFTQFAYAPLSDTTIMLDLDADATTTGHNWHVHEDQVGASCTTGDAGAHYDPWAISGDDCELEGDDALCGLGEMAAKHGALDLPATGASKYFFSDTRTPLSGAYAIGDARSLVLHDADGSGEYSTCANLVLASAAAAGGDDDDGVDATAVALGVTIPLLVCCGGLFVIGSKEMKRREAVKAAGGAKKRAQAPKVEMREAAPEHGSV